LLFDEGANAMSDDKTKRGGADRQRIDVNEDYECRHWAKKFGVGNGEFLSSL
jgi:uncharacterized protein DUF3606